MFSGVGSPNTGAVSNVNLVSFLQAFVVVVNCLMQFQTENQSKTVSIGEDGYVPARKPYSEQIMFKKEEVSQHTRQSEDSRFVPKQRPFIPKPTDFGLPLMTTTIRLRVVNRV